VLDRTASAASFRHLGGAVAAVAACVLALPAAAQAYSQQGPGLEGAGESGTGHVGSSVAHSADGNTALVGGYSDNAFRAAAWVFTRSVGTWTEQGEKLVPKSGEESGTTNLFGWQVALSRDGNTALIGAIGDGSKVGAAWVFTRSGGVWTQQGEKLVPKGGEEIGAGEFGDGVALSGDGNTAIIGAGSDNGFVGAAWVFTRSGGAWSQQGPKLVGSEETGKGELGYSVALSSDGNTALAGGTGDNVNKGAAWVFTRSGSTWSQQGEKLTGSEELGASTELGYSAALSAGGNTALLGGPQDNGGQGAAWVFSRGGSKWRQSGPKITPLDEVGSGSRFGTSVALTSEGGSALIGGPFDSAGAGAVWQFAEYILPVPLAPPGLLWHENSKTRARELGVRLGASAALSADGGTALAGAPEEASGVGAAFALVQPPPVGAGEGTTAIGPSSANLYGFFAAGLAHNGYFQYGTSSAYGSATPLQSSGETWGLLDTGHFLSELFTAEIGGLAPATTYHFRLVSESSGGISYGADSTFTTEPVTCTCLVPAPVPPHVSNASQTHKRWREGPHAATFARRARLPVGTTFSFRLNTSASVTFAFTQKTPGRSVRGKCVAQTPRNRHKHRCSRVLTRGTLSFAGHAGTNKVAFDGVIQRRKRLAPGSYTLLISASNSPPARSNTAALSFTIVR
jgi:hypothetical protein